MRANEHWHHFLNAHVIGMERTNEMIPAPLKQKTRLDEPKRKRWYLLSKRLFDVTFSLIAMLVLSPVFLITAIAIKIEDPKGKVFYTAPRGGLHGIPFPCYKFRSMYADADAIKSALASRNEMHGPVFKIKNDPRITKVGRFIRKTSIDELPQLMNVLQGHISFVGPRPLPIAEAAAIPPEYKERERVLPGITCIWQISGRNDVDFSEWMEMDLTYVHAQSFWLDMKILLLTLPAVFAHRGAS